MLELEFLKFGVKFCSVLVGSKRVSKRYKVGGSSWRWRCVSSHRISEVSTVKWQFQLASHTADNSWHLLWGLESAASHAAILGEPGWYETCLCCQLFRIVSQPSKWIQGALLGRWQQELPHAAAAKTYCGGDFWKSWALMGSDGLL